MKVVVMGAGVIGSVYAARLAAAGHDVGLVARGARLAALTEHGVSVQTAGRRITPDVAVIPELGALPAADVVLVSVRAHALDPVLELLASAPAPVVGFLQHLGPRGGGVAARVGRERTVPAFPGIGGRILDDGTVE